MAEQFLTNAERDTLLARLRSEVQDLQERFELLERNLTNRLNDFVRGDVGSAAREAVRNHERTYEHQREV